MKELGADWQKKMSKLSKKDLIAMITAYTDSYDFPPKVETYMRNGILITRTIHHPSSLMAIRLKSKLIGILRSYILIDDFNNRYKEGDVVYWRRKPVDTEPYKKCTVKSKAYMLSRPVVLFNEEYNACSIEPNLLNHEANHK
jgi:hypothetical protein